MKKIFSIIVASLMMVCMTACSTEIDKECGKIADAMVADNVEEVATLTDAVYAKMANCESRNLADLSLAYNYLANKSTDNTTRLDYIKKVIECYNAAMAKDADNTKKCYEVAKVDMANIVKQYEDMIPQFEQLVSAEQQQAAEGSAEETTEEAAEEE